MKYSNIELRPNGENPVTNCLRYGMALQISSFFLREEIFRIPLCTLKILIWLNLNTCHMYTPATLCYS